MLSVIIPARDVGPFVEAAVRSALGQTVRESGLPLHFAYLLETGGHAPVNVPA